MNFKGALDLLDEILSEEKIRDDFFNHWINSGLIDADSNSCVVNGVTFVIEAAVPITVVSRTYVSRRRPGYPSARAYAAIGGLVDDLGSPGSGMYDSKMFFIELNYNEDLELISIYEDISLYAL